MTSRLVETAFAIVAGVTAGGPSVRVDQGHGRSRCCPTADREPARCQAGGASASIGKDRNCRPGPLGQYCDGNDDGTAHLRHCWKHQNSRRSHTGTRRRSASQATVTDVMAEGA
jgi:hypothetical protein